VLADRIATRYADVGLPTRDLVHGNLDLPNLLVSTAGDLVAVDTEGLGAGTRVYDVVGVLMTAAALRCATPGR
jgi:hypothetical protein